MIELERVSYVYPNQPFPALREVSLKIPSGSFVLVAGASGSGKSTLLRCLNGLVPHFYGGAFYGRVRVEDREPLVVGPRGMSERVGFVFQNPEAQFVTRLVEDELAFAMENHNFAPALMRRRVEQVLDQLSIADLRGRSVETLSGGQKQLVAIAGVLTLQPSVLVLDEPTSQLDPQAAEEVLTILRHLNSDFGLTILISEHRLERVAQYADSICYFPARGQPPLHGEPRAMLAQMNLAPPLAQLARHLNWKPLPLTLKEARPFAEKLKARLQETKTPEIEFARAPKQTRRVPALAVENLWFRYNDQDVLKGIALEARAGEWVALMGRNGAGKSTLLKNIVGLLKPQRGRVRALGMDIASAPLHEITRKVGFVPQSPGRLLFNETLEQELQFTCRAHNVPPTRIEPLLRRLDLQTYAQTYPRDLSVGEQQRAALAAILIAQPRVLLLDEPTRGLDYESKEKLRAILGELRADGVTIVMATHDVELVAQGADRIVLLGGGEIVADDAARKVMTDSLVFASQINKLLRDERYLTVRDVLESMNGALAHA